MDEIEPFHVMEIGRRAAELEATGRRVIHLEIGQPDFAAPPQVIEAAVAAIRSESMGYTAALGISPLRRAISRFYQDRYGVDVDPGRVMVTAGASGAFVIAMGALVDPGDEVLMPDPCYPCNRHFVRLFGGVARTVPVGASQRYQLSLADLERHWTSRSRGVLLASPSNPTGTTVPRAELAEMIDWTRARGGWVMVDEIYNGLTYGAKEETALSLSDEIFVVNSFSKYFNMTGWRLGWLVAPERYVREMERLAQNAFICVSAPAQHAALAAFRPDTVAVLDARRDEFRRRRDFLVPALRELGFDVPLTPDGAFYVYAGCTRFSGDSHGFALAALENAGVAFTPGLDFGSNHPERYVRFAYTRAMSDIEEGVERLRTFLRAGGG
ncbi:MAG: pyridoxal phosphate-dependent aminotransferase [Burkholderiales bacterium]|jgi:aspartate/methionine/tyrosine aminotransferase|nr:pyridoxal phosphate-dependent aminotransferase [Burkholderiales bacterium]